MREYLLVLVMAAVVTYLCTGATRRIAHRIGAMTAIRDRDVHVIPTPRLGGLAIMLGVAVAIMLAGKLPFLGRIPEVGHDSRALLAGAAVMFVLGAVDDVHELDPLTKLAGQVVAAGLTVVLGVQFLWFPLPGGTFALPPVLSAVLTALVIIVMANAVNFVDGLDGLATGICIIGALAFFSYSYLLSFSLGLNRALSASLVMVAVAGACLGFLPHNFYPTKIFMSDSGALPLGALLGGATVNLTGFIDPSVMQQSGRPTWVPVMLPLILAVAVLALPSIELVSTVIRRTRAGRPVFSADRQHLHHRLMFDIGHTHRGTVLLLWAWAALIAFGVVAIGLIGGFVPVAAVAGVGILLLLGTLVSPARIRRRRERRPSDG